MRIWFEAQDHPPTNNWQRPDESMNTRRSWSAKGMLLAGPSFFNWFVGWRSGRLGRYKRVPALRGIYTNMKIKSKILILHFCTLQIKFSLHPHLTQKCLAAISVQFNSSYLYTPCYYSHKLPLSLEGPTTGLIKVMRISVLLSQAILPRKWFLEETSSEFFPSIVRSTK